MTDFHNDQWKGWLDDFDMDDPSRATPLQGNSGTATNEFTWDGAPVGQELSWGRTLSEDAANSSDFLKRLAAQVEGNKRALETQQMVIDTQTKKLKVLDKVTAYLQELEAHLDKLRDMFKEVMPRIDPDWDLKSPKLPTIMGFDEQGEEAKA